MTLAELIAAHPDRFHPQTWYAGEVFTQRSTYLPDDARPPLFHPLHGIRPTSDRGLPYAARLAALFLRFPDAPVWAQYLWCADTDAKGQRVYVGGATPENGRRFEIHRHLAITDQWGLAA